MYNGRGDSPGLPGSSDPARVQPYGLIDEHPIPRTWSAIRIQIANDIPHDINDPALLAQSPELTNRLLTGPRV